MKNIYKFLAPLCVAVLTFMSCMNDKEIETSPECGILSFNVASIHSLVPISRYDNVDTVVSRVISGSDIFFNIDQVNGRIFTVDSLAKWVDLTRVVPSFVAYGNVFAQRNLENGDSLYYYVTSGSDSINFTKPVKFISISSDGLSSKTYTVEMFKSNSSVDTLEWKASAANMSFGDDNHPVVLGNSVYMFYASDGEGKTNVALADGKVWNNMGEVPVAMNSVLTFDGKLYGVGATDGCIYSSADAQAWEKVSDKVVRNLLASDDRRLYATDGTGIIGTSDFQTWEDYGSADADYIPTSCISCSSHTSKTNNKIQIVTFFGLRDDVEKYSLAWYKVSSADPAIDQDWAYENITPDNRYPFPYLAGLSVTRYGESFYAIGKEDGTYKYLYNSPDNGISWHKITSKYVLPSDINDYTGKASIFRVGEELWIVRDFMIWRGVIK